MSNRIEITGNLTGDPELRFTPSGAAVANFTVADTPRKFNKDTNQWEDSGETLFLRCAIWREWAEEVAEKFTKGQRVTVLGRIKQRSYEKDGQQRIVVECDAESVTGHPRKADRQGGRAPGQYEQPAQQPDAWASQQGQQQSGGWDQQQAPTEPPF